MVRRDYLIFSDKVQLKFSHPPALFVTKNSLFWGCV